MIKIYNIKNKKLNNSLTLEDVKNKDIKNSYLLIDCFKPTKKEIEILTSRFSLQLFDINLALELVDEMYKAGLNLLVIDCADGVRYKSHPELARKYTVPMSHLKKLVKRANEKGIEVVPKLNFAQSRFHCHNHWMYPYKRRSCN